MNSEIVARLSQSLALPPIDIPPDLERRMMQATEELRANRGAWLVQELAEMFPAPPPAPREMTPEAFYQLAMDLARDEPRETREAELADLVEKIRKRINDPHWNPPEPGVSRYFDTWEGRDLLRQKKKE